MSGNMEYLLSEERQRDVKNPRLNPNNRVFDPQFFIKESLKHVSYQSLELQLVDEVGAAETQTREALKDLIRDNLGTFIDSKDAMDHVYNTDNTLFSGEALSGIMDAFEDARAGCDDLVAPTQDLHEEMIRNRKSQDMLEKLYTVLRVPGVLYECCGVRVALRRSTVEANAFRYADGKDDDEEEEEEENAGEIDDTDGDDGDAETNTNRVGSRAGRHGTNAYGDDVDPEDEDEEEGEDGHLTSSRRLVGTDGAVRELHGALESSSPITNGGAGGGNGAAGPGYKGGEFLIAPDEEVFQWYSTPLVRLGDALAQRARVEETGNIESAVLHLRRAMLYLEETYDLERGTLKYDEEEQGKSNKASRNKAGGGEAGAEASGDVLSRPPSVSDDDDDDDDTKSQRHGVGATAAVGKSAFIFRFSIALLRAALYLLEQLADELVRSSASDTVLIEDTLSMMMDVSIATVKLYCFCEVMLPGLGQRNAEALASLRNQLAAQNNGVDEDEQSAQSPASGLSFASSSPAFDTDGTGVSCVSSSAAPLGRLSSSVRRVQRHPVQFFIKVTSQEHNRLMLGSAVDLLQEANEWGRKATAHARPQTEAELAAVAGGGAHGGNHYEGFDSGSLAAGGLFGSVVNDSFSNSFLFTKKTGATTSTDGPHDAGDAAGAASGSTKPRAASFVEATGFTASSTPDPNTTSSTAGSVNGTFASASASGRDGNTYAADTLGHDAEREILHAFRTPEAHFETYTTIRIGPHDMTNVLEYSCAQVYLHSKSMLSQLLDRSDTEINIMAQGPLLNTFAARLLQSSVDNLEHVLVSYWGGIATTIHAGVFDFRPEPGTSLGKMINAVIQDDSHHTGHVGKEADSRAVARAEKGEEAVDADEATAEAQTHVVAPGVGSGGVEELPRLRYLPVLCEAALPAELREAAHAARDAKATGDSTRMPSNLSFALSDAADITLRDLSMYTVRHMIRSASSIVSSVFLAFVNRGVLAAFVRSLAQYTEADVREGQYDESVELHAAVLVEVLLGQWERMMTGISDAVLRMKVAVGESCTQSTVSSEAQLAEAADLLEELERLRSTCLACYLHGVGMLAKAYVTALPLLSSASATEEDGESGVEHRVRARLSRDFVSTRMSNKLLNTLALCIDRIAPLLRRHSEVFDSADLFAAKAEDVEAPAEDGAGAALPAAAPTSRRRVLRRRRRDGGGTSGRVSRSHSVAGSMDGEHDAMDMPAGFDGRVDAVTQSIADHHSRLVQAHLSEHEGLVQALVSNVLLVFVDTLHRRGHSLCGAQSLADKDMEYGIVESIADALALPTATAPVFVENILQPAVFEELVLLTPEAVSPQDRQALLASKVQQFYQIYLSVVSEHCQLAVDAMVGMYLSIPQQYITNEVRRGGFIVPLFDWQRSSAQTCENVRPYIANCIVRIAEAGETLHWIRQPALGAAVTQRLVAHLAMTFVGALNADVNPFEMSSECSPEFLTYGTLLLEAEALSILETVHAVLTIRSSSSSASASAGQDVQPELLLAEELLRAASNAMIQFGNQTSEVLAAVAAAAAANTPPTAHTAAGVSGLVQGSLLTISERTTRRNALVEAASRASRFMVAAIRTHMDEASLASSAATYNTAGQGQKLIERLAARKEGYEAAAAAAAAGGAGGTATTRTTRKKKVKKVKKSPALSAAGDEMAVVSSRRGSPEPGQSPRVRKVTRPTPILVGGAGGGTESPPLPASPTSGAGVTFNLSHEQEAAAAMAALMSAGSGPAASASRASPANPRPRRVARRQRVQEDITAAEDQPGSGAGRGGGDVAGRPGSRTTSRLPRPGAPSASEPAERSAGRRSSSTAAAAATSAAPPARRARPPLRGVAAASDEPAPPPRSDSALGARGAARRERRERRFGRETAM